jgi:hypothetical protein
MHHVAWKIVEAPQFVHVHNPEGIALNTQAPCYVNLTCVAFQFGHENTVNDRITVAWT